MIDIFKLARSGAGALAWALLSSPAAAAEADPAGDAVRGARIYRQFCMHCHGPNLVNPGTVSFDLRRLEPGENPRFTESVSNGKGNMPSWKAILKPGDLESLWAYIMDNRYGR